MEFNRENKIVQICAKGMELEGLGELAATCGKFEEAWNSATNDLEKSIAAHYVARHQKSVADKLIWDKTALAHALNIHDEIIKENLPSLYLNIGKCYEDLNDIANAETNYQAALSFADFLPDDGYGHMIKAGIVIGLQRIKQELPIKS